MPATRKLLAFDLGAESGRGVLGLFDGQQLQLEVVHRFPNDPVRTARCAALGRAAGCTARCCRRCATAPRTMAAWTASASIPGASISPCSAAAASCSAIRATTAIRTPKASWRRPSPACRAQEIFRQTGMQFMRFNTLFQLLALQRDRSPLLDAAETLLFMPDLFHYFFTGVKVNEMHRRQHQPDARPGHADSGPTGWCSSSACRRACSAAWCSRARCWGRCGASVASETGLNAGAGDRAGHARHRLGRRGRAGGRRRRGRTSVPAPGR